MATEFGKLLRIIRIKSGDSARDMAKKLNLSPSYLSAIENGKRSIPYDMEKLLTNAYSLSNVDKNNIRSAIIETSEVIKINISDFSDDKKDLLYSLLKDEISKEKLNKIYEILNSD